jgi:nitrogen fixation protein NifU and related proteins
MTKLTDLYQEMVVDHSKRPRNFGALTTHNCLAEGFNPLCGDKIRIYLQIENSIVVGISFEGTGCAISTASASMMTEALKGKTITDAEALFKTFHHLVTHSPDAALTSVAELDKDGPNRVGPNKVGLSTVGFGKVELGKLEVFSGVHEFPTRVKCATLAWHTFVAALRSLDNRASAPANPEVVTTE